MKRMRKDLPIEYMRSEKSLMFPRFFSSLRKHIDAKCSEKGVSANILFQKAFPKSPKAETVSSAFFRMKTAAVAAVAAAAFAVAAQALAQVSVSVPRINLPEDERPRADAPFERWQFSGHLQDDEGRRYGLTASFFIVRFDGLPDARFMYYCLSEKDEGRFHSGSLVEKSAAATMKSAVAALPGDVRFALSPDISDESEIEKNHRFMKEEPTVMGEALGLRFDGNYFVNEKSPGRDWEDWRYGARLTDGAFEAELEMKPERGPMFAGGDGVVGLEHGGDLFLYSFPRMAAKGRLRIGGETRRARGVLWYDHKYGALGDAANPAGWDWFRVQLEDGTDMSLLIFRRPDTGERFHRLATVKWGDGRVSVVRDIVVEPLNTWTSPDTGVVYPLDWAVAIPSLRAHLTIRQDMPYQETRVFGPLRAVWAGSGRAEAVIDGERQAGTVFTELAGYRAEPEGALP
ncbi:MAG: Hydroxyneurosporene synthase (CrtC) [bacterium ADurb.Bin236]|nr:MAG: Hydroxyneurosporene synthase (CrtC) [bacterium ADurb.Bin236]HOY62433.1 lipocalin family protein [bacterium]HPN96092.1 lipocalin family protein [bacterium]